MAIADHIATFIEINTAGRTHLLCRSLGIWEPFRIEYHTRALREAVLALARDPSLSVMEIDRILDQQLRFLEQALKKAPAAPVRRPARALETPSAEPPHAEQGKPRRPRRTVELLNEPVEGIDMENRLEKARKPLRKLLQEDCVRLGLLDLARARKLSAQLAGKSREEAEAEVVVELRNNLHQQVRAFLKKFRGGPWNSPARQEDLRLDIGQVSSVQGVVNLTRRILQESKDWEERARKGLFHNILGGKVTVSTGRK